VTLSRRGGLLLAVVMLLGAALVAQGVVPKANRIARATAKANRAAARNQALQLDLTLRVADREPIGSGSLVTHPTGLARLELRDAADRTERHLLLGTEHAASRNGNELEAPREFLPPLFLLQVDSPATLEQALADYGLDLGAAALAPCGKSICYVLGDPSRVAPPPPTPEERAWMEAARQAGDPLEPEADAEEPAAPGGFFSETFSDEASSPSVWVDSKSFEIVRIESRSGVIVEFAPAVDFSGIRFPDSITIHEPERDSVRFDILGVTAVNAAAAGFTRAWLLAPTTNPERSGDNDDRVPAAPQGSPAEEPSAGPRAPKGQPRR
jgi:hypothetical protein